MAALKTQAEDVQQMEAASVTLPPKTNQQEYTRQGYSAIANSVYISLYGNKGAALKISQSKLDSFISTLEKDKSSWGKSSNSSSNNVTLGITVSNYVVTGTGVNNIPLKNREQSKYARVNYSKQLILFFQKEYEFTPPQQERVLISDYGIVMSFEQIRTVYSFIDTKEAKMRVINTSSSQVENDI